MPKILTVMGWNIENFGDSKYDDDNGGDELIEYIATVVDTYKADVVGFCELRSKRAADVGKKLKKKLDTKQGGTHWQYKASQQFGKKRWEEYLFIWRSNKVTSYAGGPTGQKFQSSFDNPAGSPKKIGFPRQSALDRPPFLGYFEVPVPGGSSTTKKQVLIAVMHSPARNPLFRPKEAAQNMAKVKPFKNKGDACLLMGDFNVKMVADASVVGSKGEKAFGDLIAAGFEQLIKGDIATSLASKKYVPTAVGDYLLSPYDQLFFRTKSTTGITTNNPGAEDLVEDSYNGGYLEAKLAAIIDKDHGNSAGTTTFGTDLTSAFQYFRIYVSDHMPVITEIHA